MDPANGGSRMIVMQPNPLLKGFADAAQSLKLYRRAELQDPKTDALLIGKLYVDPLQNNAVLETLLRPNTTFIIGRKGTGKSTVFQRAQDELRKQRKSLSAYVDIKTVYESAEVDPEIAANLATSGAKIPEQDLRRLLLYRSFCKAVFIEIQKEIKKQINSSYIEKVKEALASRRNEVIERLNDLLEGSFEAEVTDVGALSAILVKKGGTVKEQTSDSASLQTSLNTGASGVPKIGLSGGVAAQSNVETGETAEYQYSQFLLKSFNITAVMEKLGALLNTIGISKLFVFIDDFSELPKEAMEIFVDTILAPLNNWSNELIKFKVAAYPGLIYLGKLDKTKMDEVYLDIFRLYGSSDVTSMEEKSIDFTRRLINSRFNHYVKRDFSTFCEAKSIEDVWRHLFFASMGNARILGHLLHNLMDSHVVYDKSIGVRAVQDAAAKYYEEKVEPYFGMQKFSHETFDERSSIFSLKELLENIVKRARDLRNYKESALTQGISGYTPSSHFHIVSDLDSLLSTLELNFFLTKFYEMKDRDSRKVSVFALNYGLCVRHAIAFGRPRGKRELRTYYIERIFDYTAILTQYLQLNQEIKCDTCCEVHGLDKLESIKLFGMMCPKCKTGQCTVTNLSRKYEAALREIDSGMLLPPTELGILETLFVERRALGASEIAEELDCSYQLVSKRGKIMEDRGLVRRDKNEKNRRIFDLTEQARQEYFAGNQERSLDLPTPDPEEQLD
jgi:DNA-binding MarR family transcriptional regulator